MNTLDTQAFDAVLGKLNTARQTVCRGTAVLERSRSELGRLDLDREAAVLIDRRLEAALDRPSEGAAELQTTRTVVMYLVEECEMLQGSLRRRLQAARKGEPTDVPFPPGMWGPTTRSENTGDKS